MSMSVNSSSNVSNNIQNLSRQLASGRQINSAADNAAGLGITQRMSAQERGLAQGTRNTADMQSLVNTAEGALSSINEGLLRLNEIAVQASSGIMVQADRNILQVEVDQIISNINHIAGTTQFNTRNLLDGSAQNLNTASSPSGTGQQVSIQRMSAEYLGLEGFNVTDPSRIDLSAVHNAINAVNAERANLGANSNRMDFVMTSNDISQLNLAASRSRIEDTDMALASMQLEQQRVLEQYQIASQRREQEQLENQTQRLFTF
jgi:flagellin